MGTIIKVEAIEMAPACVLAECPILYAAPKQRDAAERNPNRLNGAVADGRRAPRRSRSSIRPGLVSASRAIPTACPSEARVPGHQPLPVHDQRRRHHSPAAIAR